MTAEKVAKVRGLVCGESHPESPHSICALTYPHDRHLHRSLAKEWRDIPSGRSDA